jgi:hypothetical protein
MTWGKPFPRTRAARSSKRARREDAVIVGIVVVALIATAIAVGLVSATTTPTTTFQVAGDAYVNSNKASSNYGSTSAMRVDATPDVMRAYVEFNVTGLTSPVTNATLRFYVNSGAKKGVTVSTTAAGWDEKALTYKSAPAVGSALASTGTSSNGSWVSANVTPAVQGNGSYAFVFTSPDVTQQNLSTKEGGNGAQLVVSTTDPVTTTTSATTTTTSAPSTTTTTAAPAPPPGDIQPTFPIRAGFYYPWFPEAWNQQGYNPFTNYNPSLGFYDGSSPSVISTQIAAMRYAGMNAGIASWWGQGSKTDQRIPLLLQGAAGSTFRWTLYYEAEGSSDPTVTQISSDLSYIAQHYGSDASYLRVAGKPVIFVYADAADACAMVDRWTQANAGRFYVVLKVFAGYKTCANQPDSWHQYAPAVASDSQAGYSFTVSPGFYKKGETSPRLARDPATFTTNVQKMAASNAPWQLVTTFNEWGEGTSVESAQEWSSSSGYGAYQDILHQFLGGSTPSTTTTSTPPTTAASTTTTTRATTTTTSPPASSGVCGSGGAHPAHYDSVVVFSFENRTWADVGGPGFGTGMPYLYSLGQQCTSFSDWTETNTSQNSLTQYGGQVTGAFQSALVNDCSPSSTCSTTADNIFRQARAAGKTAINYVEGATTGCSASGNAAKHIPDLYMWGADDRSFCNTQVRPYSEFNPSSPPNFAFITPTLCNDGHDCGNSTVDAWARANIQPVLDSAGYKAGRVAVFVWYDEDHPVPNMWITPTAAAGVRSLTGAGYTGTLSAWESMLGFPCLAGACSAPDMRSVANS